MQKCKYAEVYISVNGSSKKKRCCICCIYWHISVYIHIFACTHNVPVSFHWISVLFLSHSCGFLRIPEDSCEFRCHSWGFRCHSWGFLQEWEGHCKVLVVSGTYFAVYTSNSSPSPCACGASASKMIARRSALGSPGKKAKNFKINPVSSGISRKSSENSRPKAFRVFLSQ